MTEKPFFSVVYYLIQKLTHFDVINGENIPPTGGLLMTSNHLSRLDMPILMATSDRTDLVAVVAKKYEKKPFFKWILEKIGTVIWLDRETTDFTALRQVVNCLRKGSIVGIAPEGTRSHHSVGLLEAKQGAAVLAAQASVPILPIGIVGTDLTYGYWKKFKKAPVTVKIGKPYALPEMDRQDRQAWLTYSTDEIMCRIAALLPPSYRGFYAEHPRLKELLKEADAK